MDRTVELQPFDGTIANASGHWVLAFMGKKVLRPGGMKLSKQMLKSLAVSSNDEVIELAPGLGATSRRTLKFKPKSYTAIDKTQQVVQHLNGSYRNPNYQCILADAAKTGLENESATVLYAEAMLTIQSNESKLLIMKEAARVLKKGGRFAIHEINFADESAKLDQQKAKQDLTKEVKHPVNPIPLQDWKRLLEEAGFTITEQYTEPMKLLEPSRIIADEGLGNALNFFLQYLGNADARNRVKKMRSVFNRHKNTIGAALFICEKR